jgi:CheY-like chemotaxis protein
MLTILPVSGSEPGYLDKGQCVSVSVLIVEDEPLVRELLAFVLSDEGFRVRTAGDGCAALAAVEEEHPDVVLTDLMMPHMDGYELIARLRRGRLVQRGIIVMSTIVPARHHAPQADLILAKPFDIDTVVESIHSLVEVRHAS